MPVPATTNPLGVKGTGEAGTTAAIAALMNAIAHAIPNGAADHMDMPATPAKVWEACQKADGEIPCLGSGPLIPPREMSSPCEMNLVFMIGLQAFDAAFGAVAGLLDAAERRLRRRDGDGIDAHHAGLDGIADGGGRACPTR